MDGALPADLRELAASVEDPDRGFFGPESLSWRFLRENTLQLAGPAAALLQVAHPQVAQGVGEHSNFREDPIGRLQRTFVAVHRIVFGSVDKALEAALATRRIHAGVRGTVPDAAGPTTPAGTRYHANRTDLLLWVHATLVAGAIDANARFGTALSPAETRGLYDEMKLSGRLFGIPAGAFPTTWEDFVDYWQDMVERRLEVTDVAREIANSILYDAGWYRAMSPLLVLLASGLMPARIRAQFGLPWNRAMEIALDQFQLGYRGARWVLPPLVLYRRAYLRGMKRTGASLPRVPGRPLDPINPLWSLAVR